MQLYHLIAKQDKILPFSKRQNYPKNRKNNEHSTSHMFDANDISARSYVRNIKCLQADSRITSTLSRHQINSKTECHSTL